MGESRSRQRVAAICAVKSCQNPTTQRVDHAREGKRPTCSIDCRNRLQYGARYRPEELQRWRTYAGRCRQYGGAYHSGITRQSTVLLHGLSCHWCGMSCNPGDFTMVPSRSSGRPVQLYGSTYPSLEHVMPLSRGGDHSLDNARIACISCNVKRGSRTDWPSFAEISADYGPDSPNWTLSRFDEWRERLRG
jgi:hypothetical protein